MQPCSQKEKVPAKYTNKTSQNVQLNNNEILKNVSKSREYKL